MSDHVQSGSRFSRSPDVNNLRITTPHDNNRRTSVRIPVQNLYRPPISPLFHPSPIIGDPYFHMQNHLHSLFLSAETAHDEATYQHNSWVKDMTPFILPCIPGPRAHQYYLILGGLERAITVTLAQMEDRVARYRQVLIAREWRNAKTREFVEEEIMERRRWGRGRGQERRSNLNRRLKGNVVGGQVLREEQELSVFPNPQCPDFEDVKTEWEHLMQGWNSDSKKPKGSVAEINVSSVIMGLGHNYDFPRFE
ncbi:hypothetical protein L211DRAFT_846087 [Terfezia boudieri ATCC MYA-4762]|uniref:Uncharacterized protein n=1 Tax=Terfezia boudieri ATCC MYA-4762 TaxID=1051890 RepID=A0A3N4LYY1_9PEZI|nr:hypothetical protein L211DRAFT_846087 [Terfezia boudieri ATCC MYA-4762]